MKRNRIISLSFLVTVFTALAALLLFMAPTEAAPAHEEAVTNEWTIIAEGLANPRHMAFGPNGALYVAEAGSGGDGICIPGPEGVDQCFGETGAVTQVKFGPDGAPTGQKQILTGLPSLGDVDSGDSATGPNDVAFNDKDLYVITGLGADPAIRDSGGLLETVGANFAQLLSAGPGGVFTAWVDLGDYEAAENPAGDDLDTNPFSLERVAGGYLVVDAGGNDLLAVTDAGVVSTVATFPDRMVEFPPGTGNMLAMDAVPTTVTVGPDGAYYVSQLTGFPFPPGAANIWRVEPGSEPEIYAEGFTNVIDIAFAADGSLYVLEFSTYGRLEDEIGAVVRVDPDGSRAIVAREGLETPTGMTIGPDHALYVSNFGVSAEEGQVVRIPTRLSEATQFSAFLSGADEVPPVATDASGVGRFSLAEDGTLSWEIAVRDIADITAAHIHPGAPGVNGPPLFTLYDGTGTFDPDNPISGDVMLTPEQVDELLAGNYYVNVHTTGNPGGEIRGQIYPARTWAFGAFLAGQNEVPLVNTTSAGRAFVTLSPDMTQLHYLVILENTPGATASHIHEAPAGSNGPVIFPLFTGGPPPFDEDNPLKGTLTPTLSQVAALLANDYYVNVHTEDYPGGEIRGQLTAVTPRLESHADLAGDNENPVAVDTDAAGLATFTLSADLSTLDFNVVVDEITDITAAHLHVGVPEGVGPIVHTLYAGGGTFDPDNPISGLLPFDAQHVLDYWSGYYYANVHTTAYPAGEIRGQLEGPSLFEAYLSGHKEVPPVITSASAHAVLALSGDASTLYYRVLVSDIENVTAAHIHAGGEDENGPIIYTLFDGTGTFDPDNPISGSLSVNADDVLAILADDYYINVHTTANPGGEIRGQITGYEEFDFFEAFLDGDQEVPPVNTDASGFGFFNFDDGNSALYYNVSVSDIADVTAAHIHVGPVGVNGPVAFPLYTGDGVFDPDNSVSGGMVLSPENLVDMFTGFYYVNVHTTAYPNGEIRGQIAVRPEVVYLPVSAK